MSKQSNHVVPSKEKGSWAVRKSGSTKSSKIFENQKEAIEYGRALSKKEKTELYIHRVDGRIREKRSYGNDPHPPKG